MKKLQNFLSTNLQYPQNIYLPYQTLNPQKRRCSPSVIYSKHLMRNSFEYNFYATSSQLMSQPWYMWL